MPSATELLRETWAVYTRRFDTFVAIAAIPTVAFIVTGLIFVVFAALGWFLAGPLVLVPLAIFLILAITVIAVWGQAALLTAITDREESIGIRESYRRAQSKVLSYWWIIFLVNLVVMGGFVFFIVPGVIFSIWLSFSVLILIVENEKGTNALVRSKEYVKGRWGEVFWRFFFVGVLAFGCYMLVSLVSHLLAAPILASLFQLFGTLFLTPFVFMYEFLLYDHLKAVQGEVASPSPRKKAWLIFFAIFGATVCLLFFSAILALVSWSVARQAFNAGTVQENATTTVLVPSAATTTP